MALSSEDHKDVKGALGKAMANKISKVTRDGSSRTVSGGAKSLYGTDSKSTYRATMYRSKEKRTEPRNF